MPSIIRIPKLLHPLQKLEVVLHLAFGQSLDRDGSIDFLGLENVLHDFVVGEELVVVFGVHLDSGHGDVAIDAVEDLAVRPA